MRLDRRAVRSSLALLLPITMLSLPGCWSAQGPEVVAYTAQDSEFAQPIYDDFAHKMGITVQTKYDAESTKTVGLAEAIVAEGPRPRCDVFWNNEILLTLRLADKGLLEVYKPAIAERYPAMYRSTQGLWYGMAARARILLVNTKVVPEADRPHSLLDMADPKWKGRIGMAKPLFGATATQAACLFAVLGDAKAKDYYDRLKSNGVRILAGNKQVAQSVSNGSIAFGVTDTDDAIGEVEGAMPVAIVYPDQGPGEMGTLIIPNTISLIRGAPHPEAARRLIDYLLSPEVESKLAAGPSAQIPLDQDVKARPRIKSPPEIRAMQVDFEQAAKKWDAVAAYLRERFTGD